MVDPNQVTRHEREIGELRGKLDSLATKEYVREVVQEQTRELKAELNPKFDAIFNKIDGLSSELRNLSEKQQRITGAADIIKTALPMLVSIATLIVLIISLLAAGSS